MIHLCERRQHMRILFLGLRKIFRLRLLFCPEFSVIVEISWKKNGRSIGENCPYYDFYNSYDWIKVSYRNFLTKIRSWFTPEVAIIKNTRRNIPKRDRNRLWNIRRSSNRNKKINNSYYFIDVTYDKETAKIFRDIYIDKIRFCDLKLLEVEDQKEVFKILKEKDFLIKQLSVFNKWNPL